MDDGISESKKPSMNVHISISIDKKVLKIIPSPLPEVIV